MNWELFVCLGGNRGLPFFSSARRRSWMNLRVFAMKEKTLRRFASKSVLNKQGNDDSANSKHDTRAFIGGKSTKQESRLRERLCLASSTINAWKTYTEVVRLRSDERLEFFWWERSTHLRKTKKSGSRFLFVWNELENDKFGTVSWMVTKNSWIRLPVCFGVELNKNVNFRNQKQGPSREKFDKEGCDVKLHKHSKLFSNTIHQKPSQKWQENIHSSATFSRNTLNCANYLTFKTHPITWDRWVYVSRVCHRNAGPKHLTLSGVLDRCIQQTYFMMWCIRILKLTIKVVS